LGDDGSLGISVGPGFLLATVAEWIGHQAVFAANFFASAQCFEVVVAGGKATTGKEI
jgi:hypothetical protein